MSDMALTNVRPGEVEAYLAGRQWNHHSTVESGSVWTAEDDPDLDVFVPHHRDFADYERRLHDLVRILSAVEKRPEDAVIADLTTVAADVIRFALETTAADSSIPLVSALELFQRARDALRASAQATLDPRPYYTSRPPARVEAFLEGVRMGQTERGSFVVPVIAPLGTVEGGPDEIVDRTDAPWGRFVTAKLAGALAAVEAAVIATRTQDELIPFVEHVQEGVNANLCTALSQISLITTDEEANTRGVGLTFSWARTRPLATPQRSVFSFAKADAPILADAAEFLKTLVPRRGVHVAGYVVRLERMEGESEGVIGIRGVVDSEERTVAVPLGPTDYARAIHAHEQGLPVSASGVLERRGTHTALAEPIEFQAPEPLF
jgi:hypothetical protein